MTGSLQFDDLFVRRFGEGPEPALLLHCGLGVSGMWTGVAEALSRRLSMIAPDLPGHGRSEPWGEGEDIHDQACEAIRPLIAPGIHLIGHSFSATVLLRLALEDPSRVASLTLIEPVLFAAARGTPSYEQQRLQENTFCAVFESGDMLQAARVFNRTWGGGVRWDSFTPRAQEDMAQKMPFIAGIEPALWHDVHGILAPGGLESLDMPVLLLRGGATVPIVADINHALAARLPHAADAVVPGAGHMLVNTHPDAVAAQIAAHLDRIGADQS